MGIKNPSLRSAIALFMALSLSLSRVAVCNFNPCQPLPANDFDRLNFFLNLKFLEAEWFLYGSSGKGLDQIDPGLAGGGPPPIGARMANLDPEVRLIIGEFGVKIANLIRDIESEVKVSIPRPQLDLSGGVVAKMIDNAFDHPLVPPFDPDVKPINYLIATNIFISIILDVFVGEAPEFNFQSYRIVFTKILAIEAEVTAVIRTILFQRRNEMVAPYNITVGEFTRRTADLANRLGKCGVKDEGVAVGPESNILAADAQSLAIARTIQEGLRILYGTGNEGVPGGFFPNGANGNIAKFLRKN